MEESNKRFLTNGLAQIEKNLQDINKVLSQYEPKSLFSEMVDDIKPEDKASLLNLVNRTIDHIGQIKENFRLEQKSVKKSKYVIVQLSDANMILDDLTPKNLGVYGKLDLADSNLLESYLTEIRTMLKKIQSLL